MIPKTFLFIDILEIPIRLQIPLSRFDGWGRGIPPPPISIVKPLLGPKEYRFIYGISFRPRSSSKKSRTVSHQPLQAVLSPYSGFNSFRELYIPLLPRQAVSRKWRVLTVLTSKTLSKHPSPENPASDTQLQLKPPEFPLIVPLAWMHMFREFLKTFLRKTRHLIFYFRQHMPCFCATSGNPLIFRGVNTSSDN